MAPPETEKPNSLQLYNEATEQYHKITEIEKLLLKHVFIKKKGEAVQLEHN